MKKIIDFSIDMEMENRKICDSIKQIVINDMKKTGVVVGLSGGIDSSVTASLCVKALGADKVLGVMLPEKESDSRSLVFAELIANQLGIKSVKQEISSVVEEFGTYRIIKDLIKQYYPDYKDTYKYKIALPSMLNKSILNIYSLCVENENNEEVFKQRLSFDDYKTFQAALSIKLRTRMIYLNFFSEKNNMALAGTTNRSEFDLGNFCKHGDGGIDFEVISHLYKTQVYEMARYLNVPEEIQNRPPSPDICSAYITDEEFFFSLPFDVLDKLLYAFNNKIPAEETAELLEMDARKVDSVFTNFRNKIQNTKFIKMLPPVCGEFY